LQSETKESNPWAKVQILSDSRLKKIDVKRLFAMDSTTITLFEGHPSRVAVVPKEGKKKGGIKAHTIAEIVYLCSRDKCTFFIAT
jgi:hypothetical protein